MFTTTHTPAAAIDVKLTNLGRQLLALIRRHGETVLRYDAMPFSEPGKDEAERQADEALWAVEAAIDAIQAATEVNIGDLAIACEALALACESAVPSAISDQHEQLHARLRKALLATIGVTRSDCDFTTWWPVGETGEAAADAR